MNTPTQSSHALLARYFYLRDEAKALKKDRADIASRVGGCDNQHDSNPRCYVARNLPFDEFCPACQQKDAPTKKLQANARERVAIMNRLRRIATKQTVNEINKECGI